MPNFFHTTFAIAALLVANSAWCQSGTFPVRPIRMVVGFTPGGQPDITARMLAPKLYEAFGQQVIVDNRPGAGGVVAAKIVADAAPDGHTLLFVSSSHVAIPAVRAKLPYDTIRDFAAITLTSTACYVLVVPATLNVKTAQDLIALAKAKPGQLLYASTGNGGSPHLATEMFRQQAKIDITHIPYKGTPPAVTDLIAGQVSMMFANTLSVLPYVNSGRLRALAISSAKRSAAAPAIPTIAENGMPGFDSVTWFGVLAPTGTPRDIIGKLSGELRRIVQTKAMTEQLLAQGADPIGSTAEEFGSRIKSDIAKWTVIIKAAGIKAE